MREHVNAWILMKHPSFWGKGKLTYQNAYQENRSFCSRAARDFRWRLYSQKAWTKTKTVDRIVCWFCKIWGNELISFGTFCVNNLKKLLSECFLWKTIFVIAFRIFRNFQSLNESYLYYYSGEPYPERVSEVNQNR